MKTEDVFKDNESLKTFVKGMKDFEELFCKRMNDGSDFTIKLEARGVGRRLIHCRVDQTQFDRPGQGVPPPPPPDPDAGRYCR